MLALVCHPFIVRLAGTCQDAECVYVAMEFVPGGEFYTVMKYKTER